MKPLSGWLIVSVAFLFLFPQYLLAAQINLVPKLEHNKKFVIEWDHHVQAKYIEYKKRQERIREEVVTAYSSTVSQTDNTPYIAASGIKVFDGMVANNSLEFGTKVKFPEVFGDKEFFVYDRMAPRFEDRFDIWFPSTEQAERFGKKKTKVVVLD